MTQPHINMTKVSEFDASKCCGVYCLTRGLLSVECCELGLASQQPKFEVVLEWLSGLITERLLGI